MIFDKSDENGRSYRDITMPSGFTFRTYEDDPYKAVQVKKSPDEMDWIEPLLQAWDRGEMQPKNETTKRNPKDKGILRKGPDGLYDVFYDMPFDQK